MACVIMINEGWKIEDFQISALKIEFGWYIHLGKKIKLSAFYTGRIVTDEWHDSALVQIVNFFLNPFHLKYLSSYAKE